MQEIPSLNKQTEPLKDKQQINPGEKPNQGDEPKSTQVVEQVDKQENPLKEKIDFSGDFIKIVEKIKQEGEAIELSDEEEEILRQELLKIKNEKIKEAVSFLEDVKKIAEYLVDEGIKQMEAPDRSKGYNEAFYYMGQGRPSQFIMFQRLVETLSVLNISLAGVRFKSAESMLRAMNNVFNLGGSQDRWQKEWMTKVWHVGEIDRKEINHAVGTILFFLAIEEGYYWAEIYNAVHAFPPSRTDDETRDNVLTAVKALRKNAG